MKKGFVVCLSVVLAAVMGLVGGWLTFPMLFPEESPSDNNGVGVPTATLANTPEKNDVFTDELLSGISSVRYYQVGIHKDEAPLYTQKSQDAEAVLVALKTLELHLENDTVYPVDHPDLENILYGGCSLTLYMKNGETYSLTYGGSTVQLSQTVNGYVFKKVYTITSETNLSDALNQTFGINI